VAIWAASRLREDPISTRRSVELHTHTTFSDGTLAPAELVKEAIAAGLEALAVTDHDIVDGVAPAREAARGHEIEIVGGVEFSTNLDNHEIHVLGLFIDETDEGLQAAARTTREYRRQRAREIVGRLRDLDLSIDFESVEAASGHGSMGRPHIAQALVSHCVVETLDEAFGRFIGVGRPAFVPKPTLNANLIIDVVHRAGGVAILAHPASSRVQEGQIRLLAEIGLDGFEVEHPKHSTSASTKLRKLANTTGLLPSSGSDYHGAGGTKLGQHGVRRACFEALRDAAESHRLAAASTKD